MVKKTVFLENSVKIFEYHGDEVPQIGSIIWVSKPGEGFLASLGRGYTGRNIDYVVDHAGVLIEIQIAVIPIPDLEELEDHKKQYFEE